MASFPYSVIDLTHTITSAIPCWSGGCGFQHTVDFDYNDCDDETRFRVQSVNMVAGIGTHMDAPAHCFADGNTIEKVSLAQLCVPCVVIDVSSKMDVSYIVSVQDILEFEATYGRIASGCLAIVRTGWEVHWHCAEKYHNEHFFPHVSVEAAKCLLERGIVGLGIDTLSADLPSEGFPVHRAVLGSGRYLVENIAQSDKLPPIGAHVMCLPTKMGGGTEAPVRLVGLVPK